MPRCNFLTYFKVDFLGSTEAWKAFGSFGYMIFCLYMFIYMYIYKYNLRKKLKLRDTLWIHLFDAFRDLGV